MTTLKESLQESLNEIESKAESAVLDILKEHGFTSNGKPFKLKGNYGSALEDDTVPIIITGAYADYSSLVIVYDLCSGCGDDDETCIVEELADHVYVLLNILGQLESKYSK
jgi:hypothetical protein